MNERGLYLLLSFDLDRREVRDVPDVAGQVPRVQHVDLRGEESVPVFIDFEIDVAPIEDALEHPQFRRPEDRRRVLLLTEEERAFLVADEVERVLDLVVEDKSPRPVDLRDGRFDAVLGDVPVEGLGVGPEEAVGVENLAGNGRDRPVVGPDDAGELERVGVVRVDRPDRCVATVADEDLGRCCYNVVVFAKGLEVVGKERFFDDRYFIIPPQHRGHPSRVRPPKGVDDQEIVEDINVSRKDVPGYADVSAH